MFSFKLDIYDSTYLQQDILSSSPYMYVQSYSGGYVL